MSDGPLAVIVLQTADVSGKTSRRGVRLVSCERWESRLSSEQTRARGGVSQEPERIDTRASPDTDDSLGVAEKAKAKR